MHEKKPPAGLTWRNPVTRKTIGVSGLLGIWLRLLFLRTATFIGAIVLFLLFTHHYVLAAIICIVMMLYSAWETHQIMGLLRRESSS